MELIMLNENLYYMNPSTGSVDTGAGWLKDFDQRDDKTQSWQEWGGDMLIHVTRDENNQWTEAE